jgi:hypothetical protein
MILGSFSSIKLNDSNEIISYEIFLDDNNQIMLKGVNMAWSRPYPIKEIIDFWKSQKESRFFPSHNWDDMIAKAIEIAAKRDKGLLLKIF